MTKPRSGPQYPVPWIATYLVTGFVLIAGSIAMAWWLSRPSSGFDYDNPDMQYLERIVLSDAPREGDFSALNGGDWKALCLAGFGGDVSAALVEAGVTGDDARNIVATAAAAVELVQETQFLLVYTTGSGETRALRHPHGFAFARQGAAVCTDKGNPVLKLPVRSR